MADFTDLLFEAEKLTHDIDGHAELPTVERSLRQVLEASNELYTRVAQTGSKDIQANLLLGSKGIDLPRISQKLDHISAKRSFENIEPIDDVDLKAVLANEICECVLIAIEQEEKNIACEVIKQSWDHSLGDFKQEKRKILNALVCSTGGFIDTTQHNTIFIDPPVISSMYMSKQEAVFAAQIIELNRKVKMGEPKPNLITYFGDIALEFKDDRVNEMWEIMKYMTNIQPVCSTHDTIKTRKSNAVVKEMVHQAKTYLESRYKTYMARSINENLNAAQRGGIPGTVPLVRSFLGIRLHGTYTGLTDGHLVDRPVWAMIYYCLRCGDISAAVDCLNKANLSQRYPELINILQAKFQNPNHPELHDLEKLVRFQYRKSIRNETDPFKRIVWAVLGCCDVVDEHSEVAKSADDWLWLKLCLIRVDYNKEDHIDYFDFQRSIIEEFGEEHYDAANNPHMYFQMLALTGQFEVAIEFLSKLDRYKTQAVHMAIALKEIYLLAGPTDYSSPLIYVDPSDPKPARRLNIVRLLMLYVRKFEIHCIEEAINYFYLLNNVRNRDGVNMFMICVSDLAQETREYEKIFGKIQINGIRTKGVLDEFRFSDISIEKIAEMVAKQLNDKGLYEEAINLYDIANNQSEVLRLICNFISQVVELKSKEGDIRERVAQKTKELNQRYCTDGFKCSSASVTSFTILKDLLTFFDHYHASQYPMALKVLMELKLVPLEASDLDERVNGFKRLNEDVCKIIPDVLLATMNILFAQYQKLKNNEYVPSRYQDLNINLQLNVIREQAKILTNFTGMLPYRMPGDTNSRLVQMEILMH